MGPLSYADTPLLGGSTAGPDGPAACGPRRGLGFETQPEPCPDPHLQASPLGYMVGGQHRVYDGSAQQ
jgi:hypothetical protein